MYKRTKQPLIPYFTNTKSSEHTKNNNIMNNVRSKSTKLLRPSCPFVLVLFATNQFEVSLILKQETYLCSCVHTCIQGISNDQMAISLNDFLLEDSPLLTRNANTFTSNKQRNATTNMIQCTWAIPTIHGTRRRTLKQVYITWWCSIKRME